MIDKENAICMIIELYAAMAQAEIEKKEKHQREGIDAKKNRKRSIGGTLVDLPIFLDN